MGDETSTTTTETPAAPVTTASPAPVTPPAQVAPPVAAKTFTQEEVNQIVSKRVEEVRQRTTPKPTAPAAAPPAGNDPPPSGHPDIQAMIVREGDFREEMVRSGASPEQIGLIRSLLNVENPSDVRAWCQQKASIMGLGKPPAPPVVTQPATAIPAEAPKPPAAAPSAPSGHALPTRDGVPDIFSLDERTIRAMPPSQIRQTLEQLQNLGNQAAGMPQRPKPPSQR